MATKMRTESDEGSGVRRRRMLVVEDDRDLASLVALGLQRAGYEVLVAHDGRQALSLARSQAPDLILLDVMLPELTGTEVATRLRADAGTAKVPIIMLTARGEESDQVAGLRAGADDYVVKPFSMRVLVARAQALLRRSEPEEGKSLEMGGVSVNLSTHETTAGGKEVRLTLTEFRLLSALMAARGSVLSRAQLMAKAMGPGVLVTDRTIDVHVTALRRKLGDHAAMIRTVRGVGYRASADAGPDE